MKTKEEIEEQINFVQGKIDGVVACMKSVESANDLYFYHTKLTSYQSELSTLNWVLGEKPF